MAAFFSYYHAVVFILGLQLIIINTACALNISRLRAYGDTRVIAYRHIVLHVIIERTIAYWLYSMYISSDA